MKQLKPVKIDNNHFQVDMRGWMCPYPKYAVVSLLEKLPLASRLDLLVDCAAATRDVPDTIQDKDCSVLGVDSISNGEWVIKIKKG
ncbi:hypothetical protein SY88_08805 [Clostridiales bacterium PH28_bin88]|nr:hypothetical protein SY88_08805 [Clostridiales bacterium PH28_bin88]